MQRKSSNLLLQVYEYNLATYTLELFDLPACLLVYLRSIIQYVIVCYNAIFNM
ncbi:hypothetical protein [Paenibacillus wenxiniae]|uniref:Uncharacterized protein n=1 Tax=Paenibacillus wenxiniae TaxID=1636843 RepID=A0ABW4RMP3_9BACL